MLPDRSHIFSPVRHPRRAADELRPFSGKKIRDRVYPSRCMNRNAFPPAWVRGGGFSPLPRGIRETLALPVYPELSGDQRRFIVERIARFYRGEA